MSNNPCLECPVRGKCCHVTIPIGGYNLRLEHVYCPHLEEDGSCKVYDHREEYPWCLNVEEMFNTGALPKECFYVKEDPSREPNPSLNVLKLLPDLSIKEQREILRLYNIYNNIPFEEYLKFTIKNEKSLEAIP